MSFEILWKLDHVLLFLVGYQYTPELNMILKLTKLKPGVFLPP